MLIIGLAVHNTCMSKSVTLPECISAGNRTGLIEVVPLPYDVDQIAHGTILDELHDSENFSSLIDTHSSVYSSVMATNRELTERLACALKRYSGADSNDKEATSALFNQIVLVFKQTNDMASNASRLYDLYSSLRPAYYKYNSTVAEALEAVRWDGFKVYLVRTQPLIHKWLGFDYKEMYWDPWVEKQEKSKKAQSAVIALDKESGRLEKIKQVAQEVDQNLEILASTRREKDIQSIRDGRSLLRQGYAWLKKDQEPRSEYDELGEDWPKAWFRQRVVHHFVQSQGPLTENQFDTWWMDLDCWCKTYSGLKAAGSLGDTRSK